MGGRNCSVCSNPAHAEIDAALLCGVSNRRIAAQFDAGEASIRRHKAGHISETMAKAQGAAEVARGDDLLNEVMSLQRRAVAILGKAEEAGDLRTALAGVREIRGCLELLGKLAGELRESGVNINVDNKLLVEIVHVSN